MHIPLNESQVCANWKEKVKELIVKQMVALQNLLHESISSRV